MNKEQAQAQNILIQAIGLAQKAGVYTLGDVKNIITALEVMFPESSQDVKGVEAQPAPVDETVEK